MMYDVLFTMYDFCVFIQISVQNYNFFCIYARKSAFFVRFFLLWLLAFDC